MLIKRLPVCLTFTDIVYKGKSGQPFLTLFILHYKSVVAVTQLSYDKKL